MNRDQCRRCYRELIPRSEWSAMSRDARAAANAAGVRETRVAVLCIGCYNTLRRRGEDAVFVRANASLDPTRTCTRCGIRGVVAALGVCPDCADVTTDLDEVGLWVREPIPA